MSFAKWQQYFQQDGGGRGEGAVIADIAALFILKDKTVLLSVEDGVPKVMFYSGARVNILILLLSNICIYNMANTFNVAILWNYRHAIH